jgi:DNA-binding NarL/FixJ family response regulator
LRDEGGEDDVDLLCNVAGREPSPELALEMAEAADELLAVFDDKPTQRKIVELKLQGASNELIAQKTELTARTVLWHLKNIRERWEFVKAYEYLVENLFAGFSSAYLARSLELSEETVVAVVEKSLELYGKECRNPRAIDALRAKLLTPERFDEEWRDDATAQTLEGAAPKIAERWSRRVRAQWHDAVRAVWNKGKEAAPSES